MSYNRFDDETLILLRYHGIVSMPLRRGVEGPGSVLHRLLPAAEIEIVWEQFVVDRIDSVTSDQRSLVTRTNQIKFVTMIAI